MFTFSWEDRTLQTVPFCLRLAPGGWRGLTFCHVPLQTLHCVLDTQQMACPTAFHLTAIREQVPMQKWDAFEHHCPSCVKRTNVDGRTSDIPPVCLGVARAHRAERGEMGSKGLRIRERTLTLIPVVTGNQRTGSPSCTCCLRRG